MMVAPLGALAQTEETLQQAPDSTENRKPFANELEEEDWDIKADFDALENAFSNDDDNLFDFGVDSTKISTGHSLTDKELAKLEAAKHKTFIPDSQRALWLSFVIPGGGQIYNRKYWKLPIFYGGFLGCMYAFNWNQQMYMDYSQAYLDIMDDNPNTNSYVDMFPPSYDIEGNISRFQTVFKNRKDRYRRWRDLSTFCFIGVYALSIIDAYVDAHLSEFDISPDLSLQWGPTSIEGPHANIGLGASLHF